MKNFLLLTKLTAFMFTLIFCAVLCAISANAAVFDTEDAVLKAQSEALEVGNIQLSGDAAELLDGVTVMDGLDAGGVLSKLLSGVSERLSGILRSALRESVLIVIVAVFCAVTVSAFGEKDTSYVVLAGVLAIAVLSVTGINSFMGLGRNTLEEINTFSKMLLPTLCSAAASSGSITSAAAKYAATTMFMNAMITVSKTVIMPLILAFIAASIGEAAIGGNALGGAAGLIKWLAKSVMLVMVIIFVAYLSITSVISGATDAVAVRAAKTTISTILPVVGSIIADASDTVLAGASILRNAVGVFGLLAVFAICIIPFLRLGTSYLLFKAAGGLSASIADKRIGKLIDAVSAAFGLTLGMTGAAALMLYISIISVIKAVV